MRRGIPDGGDELGATREEGVVMDELKQLEAAARTGQLSRREVLKRAAALGFSAPAIAALLAACARQEATPPRLRRRKRLLQRRQRLLEAQHQQWQRARRLRQQHSGGKVGLSSCSGGRHRRS